VDKPAFMPHCPKNNLLLGETMKKFSELNFKNGQGLIEYGLLLALLAIGAILIMSLMGVSISDIYCRTANGIGGGKACNEQKIYCEDNFDGDAGGWQPVSGSTTTAKGQMCFYNYMQSLNRCSMKMPASDYVINMNDVVLTQGNGYGVYFRATNNSSGINGYVFQYDPGATGNGNKNGSLLIRRWINGVEVMTPIAIAPMSGATTYNTPHDFKIVVKGNAFTVFMDGKQILSANDSTYPTGGVGLRSWDSTSACMSDFSIINIP
jgi:Flp pilus assembly pilin Flp